MGRRGDYQELTMDKDMSIMSIDLEKNKIYYNIGEGCYELVDSNNANKDIGDCSKCCFKDYKGKCPKYDSGVECNGCYLIKRA